MKFGERVKQIRNQKGLSQAQICKALGYASGSYISDIELGKFIPKVDKLEKLAQALGISQTEMDDLLLEHKIEKLGLNDSTLTLMFKEVPKMTREEKRSVIQAYEAVVKAREQKRGK